MCRIINLRWFFVIPILSVVMYTALKLFPAFYFAAGKSVALICIAATLWKVMHVRDAAFRFLNTKALVKIGVLSYSIYVWQQVFLNPTSASFLNRLPLNLLLVCAAAALLLFLDRGSLSAFASPFFDLVGDPQAGRRCTTVRIGNLNRQHLVGKPRRSPCSCECLAKIGEIYNVCCRLGT